MYLNCCVIKSAKTFSLIFALLASFLQPVMAMEKMEVDNEAGKNAIVRPNIEDLPDEIIQNICIFAVYEDTLEASKTMLNLRLVYRRLNAHLTDLHFLHYLMARILDIDLEKAEWQEKSYDAKATDIELKETEEQKHSYYIKRVFNTVYFSKLIQCLQHVRNGEAIKKVFAKILLDKDSPLSDSRFFAYRAGLFQCDHEADTDDVRITGVLKDKAKSAVLSFLDEIVEDDNKKRPIDHHKDEALCQLYFRLQSSDEDFRRRTNGVLGNIEKVKAAFQHNTPETKAPAYLLRLIALHDPSLSSESRVKFLVAASVREDVIAQYKLSQYYNDKGNLEESIKWLEKSAEQGHLDAMFKLGQKYKAEGNSDEAINWLKKSAEQGHLDAMFELGQDYLTGNGVLQDVQEGIKWLTRSAKGGQVKAFYELGIYHAMGFNGHMPDMKKATDLCAHAAECGVREANAILICEFGNSYAVPLELRIKYQPPQGSNLNAYAAGHYARAKKQYKLGLSYAEGDGVQQNWIKAARLFAEAAFLGHAMAQRKLASCYEEGQGVPKDRNAAIRWFQQAATLEQRRF
ncbi:MAG TPA: tetratricopeptide repeat protein [Alphaproteobacteria bacterium]|nr:tetratricopeptide repeat protein [Alphaproteobacteria bacterium]